MFALCFWIALDGEGAGPVFAGVMAHVVLLQSERCLHTESSCAWREQEVWLHPLVRP